ncbi:PEGA domain-containing protein [uncultured Algimonas sp.]|uniref:PEGA domain-containing protein n=1 Tax=uncultured Algimonas sp. TaxID=1547920 RepID=UPI00261D9A51|nr:PEGA domain-containing protein [uncultured Algimonas sp.]
MHPRHAALYGLVIALGGCATIVAGQNETVTIVSEPTGATVTFRDAARKLNDVECVTPCEIELPRSTYRTTVEMAGYSPFTYQITPRTTLGRSILSAGSSYAAIIDSDSGADKALLPRSVTVDLAPAGGRSTATDEKGDLMRTLDYGAS